MNGLPPLPRDQGKVDADHLTLLAIFHFVLAGFAILGLLFIFVHYTIFHAFFSDPKLWQNQRQAAPPQFFFDILKWFYLFFGFWCVSAGILNLISGLFIRARKHRIFSLVVSAVNCVHLPFGTVLGVFTMMVLMRESVRELYESRHL